MTQARLVEALDQVLELTTLLGEDMTSSLAEQGLTPSRAHLLWLLHHGGPVTQRVLAEALAVSPRNVTGLVDALVQTGFVTREPHPADRRATLVTLTPQGSAVTARMEVDQQELAQLLFGELSARELAGLTRGLAHVLDRLRRALADAKETPDA